MVEKIICRSIGRNPMNPSDRTTGAPTEQRLEPNSQGLCNTLTSVAKDNYVLEIRTVGECAGNTERGEMRKKPEPYNTMPDGTCRTIKNQYFKTSAANFEKSSTYGATGVLMKINRTLENERSIEMAKVGQISSEGSQCGSVYSDNGNSPTLTAGTHGDANSKVCTEYRIRKLTAKECWRLMSFRDEDFYKAEKINSKTQLYRQAGNSICVNVLMAIFSQLNLSGHKTWNEMSEKDRRELVAKCRDYD